MEIERKFTIKHLPDQLEQYTHHVIEQAYLCTDPVVRVRKEDSSYYMSYKGSGMMSREEYNLPLTAEAYEHLIEKADGIIITKTRYIIPIKNIQFAADYMLTEAAKSWQPIVELDVFQGALSSLIMAEVEFPDEATANAYIPEDWFLLDVTLDKRYHNSNMSKHGLPC